MKEKGEYDFTNLTWIIKNRPDHPTGKMRHEFGKNCAIVKDFGTHIKNCTMDLGYNCAIVTWKMYLLHKIEFFCIYVPIHLTIAKCLYLEKNGSFFCPAK